MYLIKNFKKSSFAVLASISCFTGGAEAFADDATYYVTQTNEPGTPTSCSDCLISGNSCCTFLDAVQSTAALSGGSAGTVYIPSGGIQYDGNITYQAASNTLVLMNNPSTTSGQVINFENQTSTQSYDFQMLSSVVLENIVFQNTGGTATIQIAGGTFYTFGTETYNGSSYETFSGIAWDAVANGSANPSIVFSSPSTYSDYNVPFPGNITVSNATLTMASNTYNTVTIAGNIGAGSSPAYLTIPSTGFGSLIFSGDISVDTLTIASGTVDLSTLATTAAVTLSGTNTMTNLNITGVAVVSSAAALGSGSTTINFTGSSSSAGILEVSGSPTFNNPITSSGVGSIFNESGNSTFTGTATLAASANLSLRPVNGSITYSGDISGDDFSSVTVNYSSSGGTVTLSGTNTFTTMYLGGTVIVSNPAALASGAASIGISSGGGLGTIQVSGSGTYSNPISLTGSDGDILVTSGSPTFSGAINGNYTMNLTPTGGSLTISGAISATDVTVHSGSGTVTFSGTNSMTNLFVAGTLSVSSAAALGSGSTNIFFEVTEGLLQMNSGLTLSNAINITDGEAAFNTTIGTTIFSGTITGGSSHTLTLTGNNSLGTINVPSPNTNIFTINGSIASGQPLVKTGAGVLKLIGTSTYTNTTHVEAGTLDVLGDIHTSSSLTVGGSGSAALLLGTGTVGNTIVSSGSGIKGGTIFGTLDVTGTLDLEDGSFFGTAISPGDVSLVAATGGVTIGDSTLVIATQPGTYSDNTVTILTGSSISGEFSSVDVNGLAVNFLTANLTYNATSVTLGLKTRDVTSLASGGNAIQVADGLDGAIAYNRSHVSATITPASSSLALGATLPSGATLVLSPTPQLVDVLASLIGFTTEKEMTYALNQLHPAQLKGMAISQENNAVRVRESLSQRMLNDLDADNCEPSNSYHKKDTSCCEKDKRMITTWVAGLGDTLKQDNKNNDNGPLTGYRTNTGGVVTGIDFLFAEAVYAGALGAYTNSNLNFEDGKGEGSISSGYAGVYISVLGPQLWGGGFLGDLFFANLSVIGSWSKYRADRHIEYGAVNLTAKNDHGGNQLLAHFDTGLNFNWWGLTVRPFDSFDYMTQTERKYQEHNAGEWELTVQNKNMMMLRNELGLQFSKCFCTCSSKWIFSPKFSWVREVRVKGDGMSVNFTHGGTQFTIQGYFPDRSLFAPGLAVTGFMLEDALVFDLYYNGEFTGGYSSNSFGGQIGYSF